MRRGSFCVMMGMLGSVSLSCAGLDIRKATAIGGSLVLRSPLEHECTSRGVKACEEFVDGFLLAVEGDMPKAKEKIKRACAGNAPDQLVPFADAIVALGQVVALRSQMGPVLEMAKLISEAASAARQQGMSMGEEPAVAAAARRESAEQGGHPSEVLDLSQFDAGTATPSRERVRWTCSAAGINFSCVTVLAGPALVTDLRMVGSCPEKMALVVRARQPANAEPRWSVTGNAQSLVLAGLRLAMRADEVLEAGVEGNGSKLDPRCAIAWIAQHVGQTHSSLAGTPLEPAPPSATVLVLATPPAQAARQPPEHPKAVEPARPVKVGTSSDPAPATDPLQGGKVIQEGKVVSTRTVAVPGAFESWERQESVATPRTSTPPLAPKAEQPKHETIPGANENPWTFGLGVGYLEVTEGNVPSSGSAFAASIERTLAPLTPMLFVRLANELSEFSDSGWVSSDSLTFGAHIPPDNPFSVSLSVGPAVFVRQHLFIRVGAPIGTYVTPGAMFALDLDGRLDRFGLRLSGRYLVTGSFPIASANLSGLVSF